MDSIFDQAGEQAKKKKEETPTSKEPPQSVSDEELKKLFAQVYKLNDTVSKKLEDAYNLMGTSAKDVTDYLENPANFTDNTQWMNVQKSRANLLKRAEKDIIFGGKEPTEKEKKATDKGKKKKDDEADKKRKGKTLGSRKGWMSM